MGVALTSTQSDDVKTPSGPKQPGEDSGTTVHGLHVAAAHVLDLTISHCFCPGVLPLFFHCFQMSELST